jgi:hypothetical protein
VASLKGTEFTPMPLAAPTAGAHSLADHSVTQLMVHNGLNPSTCARLKKLFRHYHVPLVDIA